MTVSYYPEQSHYVNGFIHPNAYIYPVHFYYSHTPYSTYSYNGCNSYSTLNTFSKLPIYYTCYYNPENIKEKETYHISCDEGLKGRKEDYKDTKKECFSNDNEDINTKFCMVDLLNKENEHNVKNENRDMEKIKKKIIKNDESITEFQEKERFKKEKEREREKGKENKDREKEREKVEVLFRTDVENDGIWEEAYKKKHHKYDSKNEKSDDKSSHLLSCIDQSWKKNITLNKDDDCQTEIEMIDVIDKTKNDEKRIIPYSKKKIMYPSKIPMPLGFNKPFGKHYVSCANCGGVGHIYKNCNYPITSFGIICYRLRLDENTQYVYPEYLMVQRKDSLNFVEFIRGKYSLKKRMYIMKMFLNMTEEERMEIKNHDFPYIWMKLWKVNNCHHFETEYKESKAKFDQIKKGYYLETDNPKDVIRFDLDYILSNTISTIYESEWGFPKGKRNINETDIDCAIREFIEETSMRVKYLKIQNRKPMEEVFTGTNQVRYKHVYYIGTCSSIDDKIVFHSNIQKKVDIDEIKHVRWLRYTECMNLIRPQNVERRELFKRVNDLILKNLCMQ